MKVDLDDLERKAQAATRGPWQIDEQSGYIGSEDDEGNGKIALELTRGKRCNANGRDIQHVLANSPDITLALVARIRDLESSLRRVLGAMDAMLVLPSIADIRESWRSQLNAEREILEKGVIAP